MMQIQVTRRRVRSSTTSEPNVKRETPTVHNNSRTKWVNKNDDEKDEVEFRN